MGPVNTTTILWWMRVAAIIIWEPTGNGARRQRAVACLGMIAQISSVFCFFQLYSGPAESQIRGRTRIEGLLECLLSCSMKTRTLAQMLNCTTNDVYVLLKSHPPLLILNLAFAKLFLINSSADEVVSRLRAEERCHYKVFPLECITELLSQTKANRDGQIEVVTQEKQMRKRERGKGGEK